MKTEQEQIDTTLYMGGTKYDLSPADLYGQEVISEYLKQQCRRTKMTKDEIKKALECCSNPSISYCKDCPYANYGEFDCCNGKMCKDALNLITEQEQEYSKLQKQFANYQLASDKEIRAQVKQAKIDALNELKEKCKFDGHIVAVYKNDIEQMIEELDK